MKIGHFDRLEELMSEAILELRPLMSDQGAADAQMYIEHDEFGVAWELLWFIVNNNNIIPPNSLLESGKMMGFDISQTSP
jgi:hypothetical protein